MPKRRYFLALVFVLFFSFTCCYGPGLMPDSNIQDTDSEELKKAKSKMIAYYHEADPFGDKVEFIAYTPKDIRAGGLVFWPRIEDTKQGVFLFVVAKYRGRLWMFLQMIRIVADGKIYNLPIDNKYRHTHIYDTGVEEEVYILFSDRCDLARSLCLPLDAFKDMTRAQSATVRFVGDRHHYDLKFSDKHKKGFQDSLDFIRLMMIERGKAR